MSGKFEYIDFLFNDFINNILLKNTYTIEHKIGLFSKVLRNENINEETVDFEKYIILKELSSKMNLEDEVIINIALYLQNKYAKDTSL